MTEIAGVVLERRRGDPAAAFQRRRLSGARPTPERRPSSARARRSVDQVDCARALAYMRAATTRSSTTAAGTATTIVTTHDADHDDDHSTHAPMALGFRYFVSRNVTDDNPKQTSGFDGTATPPRRDKAHSGDKDHAQEKKDMAISDNHVNAPSASTRARRSSLPGGSATWTAQQASRQIGRVGASSALSATCALALDTFNGQGAHLLEHQQRSRGQQGHV